MKGVLTRQTSMKDGIVLWLEKVHFFKKKESIIFMYHLSKFRGFTIPVVIGTALSRQIVEHVGKGLLAIPCSFKKRKYKRTGKDNKNMGEEPSCLASAQKRRSDQYHRH